MRVNLKRFWQKMLQLLRLSPLSLAKKCQLMFGVAVIFILLIALLLPYIWMGQLTKKDYLDTERAKAETLLFRNHFRLKDHSETPRGGPSQMALAPLDNTGAVLDGDLDQFMAAALAQRVDGSGSAAETD